MKISDKKVIVATSSVLSVLFLTGISFAKSTTSVNVSRNGETNVSVTNDSSDSTTTTTTKSTGRTDIVIECNGVKKEYHSDKAENVTLNCDDSTSGTVKSQVNIKSNTSPTAKVSQNQISEEEKENINDEKKEIKEKVLGAKTKLGEERRDLFEQITQIVRNFFKSFHF